MNNYSKELKELQVKELKSLYFNCLHSSKELREILTRHENKYDFFYQKSVY